MCCHIETGKILEPAFPQQINQTKAELIVLIHKSFCKDVELGCNCRCETVLATQYIPLYQGKNLKVL